MTLEAFELGTVSRPGPLDFSGNHLYWASGAVLMRLHNAVDLQPRPQSELHPVD
jgi:hypothetical protein